MAITKNSGRLLGLLFLTIIILGGIGISLRGLVEINTEEISFLSSIVENTNNMYVAIGLDIIANILIVWIAFYVYRLIKTSNLRYKKVYLGITLINFTVIIISNLIHVWLISIGTEFESLNIDINQDHIATAESLYNLYFSTHFTTLILNSIANWFLFYFLLKIKVIPKWLAIWGILASIIVSIGGLFQLLEIEVSSLLFIQNGIFMLVFILRLLFFGFKTHTYKNG